MEGGSGRRDWQLAVTIAMVNIIVIHKLTLFIHMTLMMLLNNHTKDSPTRDHSTPCIRKHNTRDPVCAAV